MNPPSTQNDSGSRLTDPHFQTLLQSDGELLDLFVLGGHKPSLLALITRFTPMLMGVIRRVVSHSQDAEDAFQATCLILMQSASKIRSQRSIAAWLYGVAYRTACRVRAKSRRQATGLPETDELTDLTITDPLERIVREIELSNLDRELQNLPAAYRDPLIEHYILGHTAREIADRMELSSSAVEGRLRRGRHMLRERLAERGASLSVCVAGIAWMQSHSHSDAIGQELRDQLTQSNAFQDPDCLSVCDPYLFQLVEGETKMQIAPFLKSAGFLGTFAATTVSLSVLALAVQVLDVGKSPSGNNSPVLQVATAQESAATAIDLAPAQASGGPQSKAKTVNSGGETMASASIGGGAKEDVIKFVKPETPVPSWLTSGYEDQRDLEKTRDVLRQLVSLDFHGLPLKQVIDEISTASGITMVIDEVSLDDYGLTSDQPISISIPGKIPMNQALDLILKPHITYEVHPTYVKIVHVDAVQGTVRYYDLSHVLPSSAGIPGLTEGALEIIDEESASFSVIGSMLVARCREEGHLKIEKLLAEIGRLAPQNLPTNQSQAKGSGVYRPGQAPFGGGMGGGGGMF